MHRVVRINVMMILLVAALGACASPKAGIAPAPSAPPSAAAERLLSAQPGEWCAPADPERECGKVLTVLIADYLQRHPADPQALSLWRRIIELGARRADGQDYKRIDVRWAFDGWAQAEFLALDLPSDLAQTQPLTIAAGPLTIIPTNLDGDAAQDYLLSAAISGSHPPVRQIRWMRWIDGAWAGQHVLSYSDDGGSIDVGDVTGDLRPDLL
ncbi:MAG TPA: hypothetical protein VD886_16750, partial [Herpetosiphonaceae bacterium]|nr:hypothetical protein [Herpetosiphonaceae bacterium]